MLRTQRTVSPVVIEILAAAFEGMFTLTKMYVMIKATNEHIPTRKSRWKCRQVQHRENRKGEHRVPGDRRQKLQKNHKISETISQKMI